MSQHASEILIVEDSPTDLELTITALRDAGLANRIQVARDGREALEVLDAAAANGLSHTFVLLDLKLPIVSGFEVLERIRAAPATLKLPVVVMTSSRLDPDIERAYRLGANSYVVKPVDFEQFSGVVRSIGLYWMLVNQAPSG